MNADQQPAIVILAAGASSRMGRPKPLLQYNDETFLDGLIGRCTGICSPVIVVLGHHAQQVRSGIARSASVEFVFNPQPERGMLSSLQCGLAQVPPGAGAILFTPVDLPGISRSTFEKLARTPSPLAIPVFEGHRGHPVRISREIASEILALPPDRQAGDVIHRHRAELVEVTDPGVLHDVDTPQEYEALRYGARS